ncbi:hypothetical protein [Pantoea ananatis]|uniref:hypothetical protein n=1 Tax=Pantoea ananas TaxID=553 RepID=UPI0023AFBE85|nr:hypothetical protein [Pantoea ananatis]
MQTQLPEEKPTGTAGRSPAAVPPMISRIALAVADAMATRWQKIALKIVSAA